MKILFINKFLYPNGGSETYVFALGDALRALGHEVEFFGMDHPARTVGNSAEAYTANMDFHGGGKLEKLLYPLKTIYSFEARRQLRKVLDSFSPDVIHLNNFNYQLTPSILVEIERWEKKNGRRCRVVYTAHDGQLVCPNHLFRNPNSGELCEKCLGAHYSNCVRGRCIHGSRARSLVGAAEARYWDLRGIYRRIDAVICPSAFMKSKLDTNRWLRGRTLVLRNFIEKAEKKKTDKKEYVLYFGRYSEEKGIDTLVRAIEACPEIPFVCAGAGPLEDKLSALENVRNVGFQSGEALDRLIREAQFSLCPSEVHDNCPFSVMESQERATPVIGARLGGVPELIEDGVNGRLFERKDADALAALIRELWNDRETLARYSRECEKLSRDGLCEYCEKLMRIYGAP